MKRLFILLSVLCIMAFCCVPCIAEQEAIGEQYIVTYDDSLFVNEEQRHLFALGETVHLSFPYIATDTDYTFFVDGADSFRLDYSDDEGYIIEFEMPANEVAVRFSAINTMLRPERTESVTLSLDENPSTGFQWEYRMEPEGILEITADWYVSDPDDSEYPAVGIGGTHHWTFRAIGNGEVVLTMVYQRNPDEVASQQTYIYECRNGLIELLDFFPNGLQF